MHEKTEVDLLSIQFDYKYFLQQVPSTFGIYQMYDQHNKLLYVGKAKNLKKRLASYFKKNLTTKTAVLVKKIHAITYEITNSEADALILEQILIKKHKPLYNIRLKDDKSYPWIMVTEHHWPALIFFRGKPNAKIKGNIYGPFPNTQLVKTTLKNLQKIFKLRQCKDSFFMNRSQPCLQYQINRCKAPCVNKVSQAEYQQDLKDTIEFLSGRTLNLQEKLSVRMDTMAKQLRFEEAAYLRDQIAQLGKIQTNHKHYTGLNNTDIIAYEFESNAHCFVVCMIREGVVIHESTYFPNYPLETYSITQRMIDFLTQFYLLGRAETLKPDHLILSHEVTDLMTFNIAWQKIYKAEIRIMTPHNISNQELCYLKEINKKAAIYLKNKNCQLKALDQFFVELYNWLGMKCIKDRIECIDISHHQGSHAKAACVVMTLQGLIKEDYRLFSIKNNHKGNDLLAIEEVIERRFTKTLANKLPIPGIILIDGGTLQMQACQKALAKIDLLPIEVIGIVKGDQRNWRNDRILYGNDRVLTYKQHPFLMKNLQKLRDEAHRLAIKAQRSAKNKQLTQESYLIDIPGIGYQKRNTLLRYLGGLETIAHASVEQLTKIPGIGYIQAKRIYDYFNPNTYQ